MGKILQTCLMELLDHHALIPAYQQRSMKKSNHKSCLHIKHLDSRFYGDGQADRFWIFVFGHHIGPGSHSCWVSLSWNVIHKALFWSGRLSWPLAWHGKPPLVLDPYFHFHPFQSRQNIHNLSSLFVLALTRTLRCRKASPVNCNFQFIKLLKTLAQERKIKNIIWIRTCLRSVTVSISQNALES